MLKFIVNLIDYFPVIFQTSASTFLDLKKYSKKSDTFERV